MSDITDLLAPMAKSVVDAELSVHNPPSVSYRAAAIKLWGQAGGWVHDCYARWHPLLPELPAELPIVIGLTAYGHCRGATLTHWEHGPRISIQSPTFRASYGNPGNPKRSGRNKVADTVLHEMIHAWLAITGRNPDHTGDWYDTCNRLSLSVLGLQQGHVYDLEKIRRRSQRVRVPNTGYDPSKPAGPDNPETISKVKKVPGPDAQLYQDMCVWPHPWRPDDWELGAPIPCATY